MSPDFLLPCWQKRIAELTASRNTSSNYRLPICPKYYAAKPTILTAEADWQELLEVVWQRMISFIGFSFQFNLTFPKCSGQ